MLGGSKGKLNHDERKCEGIIEKARVLITTVVVEFGHVLENSVHLWYPGGVQPRVQLLAVKGQEDVLGCNAPEGKAIVMEKADGNGKVANCGEPIVVVRLEKIRARQFRLRKVAYHMSDVTTSVAVHD